MDHFTCEVCAVKFLLERYAFGQKATLGKLYADGEQIAYCLEDVMREITGESVSEWKIYGKTAIPKGTYKVITDFSAHFGHVLPHVLDVPGFEGIRIHPGNTDVDTDGCILVGGKPTGEDFIPNSRATFEKVFAMIEQAEQDGGEVTIEIRNGSSITETVP